MSQEKSTMQSTKNISTGAAHRKKEINNSRDKQTLLAYFQLMSEKIVPPSLWSMLSKLKLMINIKEQFAITSFADLIAFIKRKNVGYEFKKAEPFSAKEPDSKS